MTRGILTLIALVPWGWSVVVAVLDRRQRVSLDDVEPADDGPLVSVIVPARDEGRGVRAATASLAAQEYGPLEVIVVDDESSDATAAEARAAATHRVRVLEGKPVPTGWVGKSWACHQGYELARGEWLLFTDADVRHAPDTVGRALALAQRMHVGGVSVLPLIETGGLVEQAIQPAAVVLIRSFVAPGPLVRSPRSPVAIAAGGFILVSRAAYEAIGGHEAMRHELVDDQMLAVRLKTAGMPLALAGSAGRVRVRMYVGAWETLRGWAQKHLRGTGWLRRRRSDPRVRGCRLLPRAHGRDRTRPTSGGRPRACPSAHRPGCLGRAVPDAPTILGALPGRRARPFDPLAAQLRRQTPGRDRLARPTVRAWHEDQEIRACHQCCIVCVDGLSTKEGTA